MFKKGFTLIELIAILTIIFVLVGICIWQMGILRTDSQTVVKSDRFTTLEQMQQMADMKNITLTNIDPTLRIAELQSDLAGAGFANFVINPLTLGPTVTFTISNNTTIWQSITP
jgi:type II secretory pathway pseudopilin PulG